ncbi:MAG: hypothetical protein KKB81_07655 [Candidatus Margulisbacteria bacterium]|nr:hypothetical protein [Candidatus Margulisiibacteriota bacterium]MBU1021223.1 hypothetical protein [Candidatus Margulisiibacteriota bacterium]MBU1729829.1 hypothetical protein [Candidatus Margulisiibacteriota bacterium]MBU1955330.1 hypothetical protein [Candidatus Margulisiibacteriota bacterium]
MKKFICFILAALFIISLASAVFAESVLESKEIVKFNKDVVVEEWESVKQVVAIGGSVLVKGRVEEDAVAIGGSVKLLSGAEVGGDAVAIGGGVFKADNAKIGGDVVEIGAPWVEGAIKKLSSNAPVIGASFSLLSALAMLALLVLIAVIFPKHLEAVISVVDKKMLANFGWGILGVILIVPIVVLLIISLIGIMLIPVFLFVVFCAYLMGFSAIGALLGRKIFKAFKTKKKPLALEVLLGALIILLISLVPFIGWLIKFIVVLAGFGGVIVTRFGMQKA